MNSLGVQVYEFQIKLLFNELRVFVAMSSRGKISSFLEINLPGTKS